MTNVSDLLGTSQTTSLASENTTSALGQEEFLTLLVAQMQNQDPLDPTDATEFTAQLAQYSQLEQLFNLNESMDNLTMAQNNSQRISALTLIGKDVLVEGSQFHLGEESIDIGYQVNGTVTSADIYIRNSSGITVKTITVDNPAEGNHTLTWDGRDNEGNALKPGTYSIYTDAESDSNGANYITPLVKAKVSGVDLEGDAPLLVTSSGEYTIEEVHGAFDSFTQSDETDEEDGT